MSTPVQETKIARKPGTFAKVIDKSRSWLYSLPPQLQPHSVKFGHSRLITEQPEDFLRRLAKHYEGS